jgi:hypothetical protein
MADSIQNATPVRGPHEQTRQSHEEYVRRTRGKGATPSERAANERHRRIAEAAHRRAELRAFAPGHEEQDWLEAEKEIEAAATEQHWGTGECP